jgi:hypothetical protein
LLLADERMEAGDTAKYWYVICMFTVDKLKNAVRDG